LAFVAQVRIVVAVFPMIAESSSMKIVRLREGSGASI
jgi:hypothetical protein